MTKQEDLIEKYIQKKLSPEEALLVDELRMSDTDFKEQLTFEANLKKAVKKADDDNFREFISALESKSSSTTPVKRKSHVTWLAAASVILLLGLSYFFTFNQKASSQDLFATYFEPYRNVIQPIERSSEPQDEKSMAFYAYENGEYEKAIPLFTALYTSSKEPYYLFYKANSLLQLDRANEAVPLLLEHLKTKDTLSEKTNWYLALAYLKLEDKQNAKIVLEKVIAEGKFKTSEAQKLLKEFK